MASFCYTWGRKLGIATVSFTVHPESIPVCPIHSQLSVLNLTAAFIWIVFTHTCSFHQLLYI